MPWFPFISVHMQWYPIQSLPCITSYMPYALVAIYQIELNDGQASLFFVQPVMWLMPWFPYTSVHMWGQPSVPLPCIASYVIYALVSIYQCPYEGPPSLPPEGRVLQETRYCRAVWLFFLILFKYNTLFGGNRYKWAIKYVLWSNMERNLMPLAVHYQPIDKISQMHEEHLQQVQVKMCSSCYCKFFILCLLSQQSENNPMLWQAVPHLYRPVKLCAIILWVPASCLKYSQNPLCFVFLGQFIHHLLS